MTTTTKTMSTREAAPTTKESPRPASITFHYRRVSAAENVLQYTTTLTILIILQS